jgi:uncharacterized protein (DUF427 family)
MSARMLETLERAAVELRHEPTEKWVRATLDGATVVDSRRALLVWEPRRISPMFAVPVDDVRAELVPADAAPEGDAPELLHPGIPFHVHSTPGTELTLRAGGQTRERAAFRPADPDLAGHVLLDFDAFGWFEEDEPLIGHPRDPFHRVDFRRSSRHVRIELDGVPIADSRTPTLVFETRLPMRFYVPREDMLVDLRPTDKGTVCPYKGEASYWSFEAGGRRHDDLLWSYERTLPDTAPLAGLVAFFDERFDLIVDGVRRARPDGIYAAAIREEVGLE